MKTDAQNAPPIQRSRWTAIVVIGLALVVLGGTLAWSALNLRARIRSQIVERYGEILDAVTLMQHLNDQGNGETISSLDDPGEQFQLALEVSRLRDMLGVRLYSVAGKTVNAFPAYITEAPLPASDLDELRKLRAVSYFSANSPMQEQDLLSETNGTTAPLLFVEVPLRADDQQHLAGVIQFLMDGSTIARQYAELDRDLEMKFSAAFIVAAGILITGLWLAMRRVQRANGQLARRTHNLLQANRELALAARTSAVGAVASHLIHGLKNPLSGLSNFVHAQTEASLSGSDTEWRTALSTTQRMEELINRVVRVLQEQPSEAAYEVTVSELMDMLSQRAKPIADAAGVRFEIQVRVDKTLSNKEADLILLILENLAQNGIEATPPRRNVDVRVTDGSGLINFEVRDQGPGLPAQVQARLFMPCTSEKKGGGGIGLAISKQLAQSLGATLQLAESAGTGCAFLLSVPVQHENRIQRGDNDQIPAINSPH